jgi:pyrroline-5-carboxylate reductase
MAMELTVGIIGVGNMGEALLSGLLKSGTPTSNIVYAQRSDERASYISSTYGIARQSLAITASADIVLICVKPKDIAAICEQIKGSLKKGAVVVSVAAGKTIAGIQSIVGDDVAVVRVMPNTPTFIGKGAAGISWGSTVTTSQCEFIRRIFMTSGIVVEVPESLQGAVTATSGSGPAYFFAFVEAMIEGSKSLGLSEEVATVLATQTIIGAAEMLDKSGKSARELRENVTSPNGTTHAALTTFQLHNLKNIVADAMAAAEKRSQELA